MSDPDPVAAEAPPRSRARQFMDRFIDTIEWVAAIFVGLVAANIFLAVLLRNLFSTAIPDAYPFGQLWSNVGPRMQRFIDVFATLVLLFVVTVQTYTLYDKVAGTAADHVLTF